MATRQYICEVPYDPLDSGSLLARFVEMTEPGSPTDTVFYVNAHVHNLARADRELRSILADSSLCYADGAAMVGFIDGPRFLRALLDPKSGFQSFPFFFLPSGANENLDADALAALTQRERFVLRKHGAGHRFEHEGGTLFSPIAWISVAYAGYFARVLNSLAKR